MQYDTTKLTNYQLASINWDRIKKQLVFLRLANLLVSFIEFFPLKGRVVQSRVKITQG